MKIGLESGKNQPDNQNRPKLFKAIVYSISMGAKLSWPRDTTKLSKISVKSIRLKIRKIRQKLTWPPKPSKFV